MQLNNGDDAGIQAISRQSRLIDATKANESQLRISTKLHKLMDT